jgi:putative flippase GtrA
MAKQKMNKNFIENLKSKIYNILYSFLKPDTLHQFIKYATTGGIAFCVEYVTFYLLYSILGLWYIWSNSIAMTVAFSISFTLNRFWSFKSKGNAFKQLIMYGTLFLVNVFVSNMVMLLFTDVLGIKPLLSKLIAVGIIVCWNFVINKKVIFK